MGLRTVATSSRRVASRRALRFITFLRPEAYTIVTAVESQIDDGLFRSRVISKERSD
jgi:hypothetical protein